MEPINLRWINQRSLRLYVFWATASIPVMLSAAAVGAISNSAGTEQHVINSIQYVLHLRTVCPSVDASP